MWFWLEGFNPENHVCCTSFKTNPEHPKRGDEVWHEYHFKVDVPVHFRTWIQSVHSYDGSGACHQWGSEHWLSVDPGVGSREGHGEPVSGVAGAWTISFEYKGKTYAYLATLGLDGKTIGGTGSYNDTGKTVATWRVSGGSTDGKSIDFTAVYTSGAKGTMHVKGQLAKDGTMHGEWSDDVAPGGRKGTWRATRRK